MPGIRDRSKKMKSMYEIIQVDGAGEIRLNVLVEGKKIITKKLSDAVERMNKISEICQIRLSEKCQLHKLIQVIFCLTAKPGMGKTSSLAYLGMEWVEHPGRQFHFLFTLASSVFFHRT